MKPELTSVTVYCRVIGASLERVWENVLDWEHLPWLHAGAFGSIECLDAGEWGWRARLTPRGSNEVSRIELMIDRPAGRYVTRTLEGMGEGNEIWTSLEPRGEHETAIEVDFRLANVDSAHVEGLARAWVRLYAGLWDEDEAMMQERQRQLDALASTAPAESPRSVDLGPVDALRAKLPLVFELGGRRYRLVEWRGELLAHSVVCPHALGPLDEAEFEGGVVRCPWHGYRFELRSGRACDHDKLRLGQAPRIEIDEQTGVVRAC